MMKHIYTFCGLGILVVGLVFLLNSPAWADDDNRTCVGNYSGTTFEDIVVPKGQTCQLNRFNVVNGDIKVRKNATLIVCPDNIISGDIKAEQAESVFISDLTISPCASAKALGVSIGGDVKVNGGNSVSLFGNPSGVAVIEGYVEIKNVQSVSVQYFNGSSYINGDVRVKHAGEVNVLENIIGGDLKIKGTSGACLEAGNSVTGKTDSCP